MNILPSLFYIKYKEFKNIIDDIDINNTEGFKVLTFIRKAFSGKKNNRYYYIDNKIEEYIEKQCSQYNSI